MNMHRTNTVRSPRRYSAYLPLPKRHGCNQSWKACPRGKTGDDKRGAVSLVGRSRGEARRLFHGGYVDSFPTNRTGYQTRHRRRSHRCTCLSPCRSVARFRHRKWVFFAVSLTEHPHLPYRPAVNAPHPRSKSRRRCNLGLVSCFVTSDRCCPSVSDRPVTIQRTLCPCLGM